MSEEDERELRLGYQDHNSQIPNVEKGKDAAEAVIEAPNRPSARWCHTALGAFVRYIVGAVHVFCQQCSVVT